MGFLSLNIYFNLASFVITKLIGSLTYLAVIILSEHLSIQVCLILVYKHHLLLVRVTSATESD